MNASEINQTWQSYAEFDDTTTGDPRKHQVRRLPEGGLERRTVHADGRIDGPAPTCMYDLREYIEEA